MPVRVRRFQNGLWVTIFGSDSPVYVPGREDLVIGTYRPSTATTGLKDGWQEGDLTVKDGDITVTVAGTIIENMLIRGRILVRAANVIIRNCKVVGSIAYTSTTTLVDANHPACSNLLLEDIEVTSAVASEHVNGIGGHDFTARRCYVHEVVDHFGVQNTYNSGGKANVLIEGCFAERLLYMSTATTGQSDFRTHNDGNQIQGNGGIVMRGNAILANVSTTLGNGYPGASPAPVNNGDNWAYPSATGQVVGVTPNASAVTEVLIELNFFDYGANSITIIQGKFGTATGAGIIIRNNRFGRNQPSRKRADDPVFARRAILVDPALTLPGMRSDTGPDTQGNVYDDTGLPVTVYRIADK